MSEPGRRRYDIPLDALERAAHVPREEQTETVPVREREGDAASAWDEDRREARLAGGA